MKETTLSESLNKVDIDGYFKKIFADEANTSCFQCGKKSKQWADKLHGIFLCLNCASLYKEMKWVIEIKSISLDLWSRQELELLEKAGNQRFKDYLKEYDIEQLPFKDKFRTKAAQNYRIMLKQAACGREPPIPPNKQAGQDFIRPPISQMSTSDLLDQAKQKALWLGSKTKEYGSKAYDKVSHKITSGELKNDTKEVAEKVGIKAQYFWGIVQGKIKELTDGGKEDKGEDRVLIEEEKFEEKVDFGRGEGEREGRKGGYGKKVEQLQQMKKVEQVEPVKKVEQVEPVKKVEQVEPVKKVEQVEQVDLLESVAEPVKPVEQVKKAEKLESLEPMVELMSLKEETKKLSHPQQDF